MGKLQRNQTGLLVIDVQEKLFPHIENSCHVMHGLQKIIQGFRILNLPIVVSEQYPVGLGKTVPALKGLLSHDQHYFIKTSFSGFDDPVMQEFFLQSPVNQWVVVGVEAHICVLQTVRDLLGAGKEIVVLNDSIGSRSIFDYSTAIAEMRDLGARISSTETVLFELLSNSNAAEFKEISLIIK